MDEDSGTFKHIVHLHSTFGQIAAYPLSAAIGRSASISFRWTPRQAAHGIATNTAQLRTFGGSPVAIHLLHDLAVSVSEWCGSLTFQAFSDGTRSKSLVAQPANRPTARWKTIPLRDPAVPGRGEVLLAALLRAASPASNGLPIAAWPSTCA